ncbi:cell number regulator 10-like isoform X2 [Cynara cardunculus var. scolymus]|uniref:cell number regulator 10-like isoform X2 n=1 Tax=Cynara cardunculus var. scolymus TaxID=59895 RepID=UPI000D628553|nr:cell number regulator 10-like isoform X2 [Cynara cardunculus var. scolymus]
MSSPNKNVYQTLLGSPPSSPDDQLEPNTTVLWSSGLCDCCADPKLCCLTCWCPCITFGRIAEGVDHGKTSCVASAGIHALLTYMTGFGWMYSYIYRSKMRKQYTGDSSHFKDCLAHFCCESCALCQEYRELQFRGSTGDEQQKYGVEAVPVTPGGMIR